MNVLDDQGRLFGVVNALDAVVLVLIAIAVGGSASFVLSSQGSVEHSQRVVVSFHSLSETEAAALEEGATLPIDNWAGTALVVDVYYTPDLKRSGMQATVIANATIVRTGGNRDVPPLSVGSDFELRTKTASIQGNVVTVAPQRRSLQTSYLPLVLEKHSSEATTVRAGQSHVVGDHPLATINSVHAYPTGNGTFVRVGARVWAYERSGVWTFGGRRLEVGENISIRLSNRTVTYRIANVGLTEPPGRPVNVTFIMELHCVSPAVANALEPGLTETHPGADARLLAVRDEPSVVVKRENGSIVAREHPVLRDVTLTVTARAYRRPDGVYFHGRRLLISERVYLDFGTLVVNGTVTDIESR